MIHRIRAEDFIDLLRAGEPWVAGTVLEEIHLVPCSTLRRAATEGHFDALKVGALFFYQADLVAKYVETVDQLSGEESPLLPLPAEKSSEVSSSSI